ncbi:MAG: ribosome-associated translation inhibitor RaiA [Sphingomonadales bacterium]
MDINVTGRKMKVGKAFSDHVRSRIEQAAEKYFSRSLEGSVTATKEAHLYSVTCTIHAGHGLRLQSRGEAGDVYDAFDNAADKLEKQLRRYKRRISNHHIQGLKAQQSVLPAQSYVLAPEEEDAPDGEPAIIAEMKTEIRSLSVGDAAMRLDLADLTAMMFRNPMSGKLNVVYRKPDGNIGWIEPQTES